ncbi:MAG TPA: hypothetical protein IGQ44_04095 [Geminocystis sp. M7585_C2015_104]|nr:hypothetical protein [Geminocystis sp. M7585_C2015_104]
MGIIAATTHFNSTNQPSSLPPTSFYFPVSRLTIHFIGLPTACYQIKQPEMSFPPPFITSGVCQEIFPKQLHTVIRHHSLAVVSQLFNH